MTNYKELYNEAPVGLWRTRIEDGKFLEANEATLQILGFSTFDELSCYLSTDLYDKQVRDEIIKELFEIGEVAEVQFIMQRHDGKKIIVSLSAKINVEKGFIEGTIKDVTGIISLEASTLIPHLEKLSLLKQDIMNKINQDDCDYSHKIAKTA